MKLRELIAFLPNYEDLLDSEIELRAIPLGCRVDNLLIEEQPDLFGGNQSTEVTLTHDNCFDGKSDD